MSLRERATRELHGLTRSMCCAQKEGKDVTKCALVVPECQKYREAHVRCKLGQLDARTRIQGNKSQY